MQYCWDIATEQAYNTESESDLPSCPAHFITSINAKQSAFTPIIPVNTHSKPRDK